MAGVSAWLALPVRLLLLLWLQRLLVAAVPEAIVADHCPAASCRGVEEYEQLGSSMLQQGSQRKRSEDVDEAKAKRADEMDAEAEYAEFEDAHPHKKSQGVPKAQNQSVVMAVREAELPKPELTKQRRTSSDHHAILSLTAMAFEEMASAMLGSAALRVEVNLTSTPWELHDSALGPLPVFLNKLRAVTCEALDMSLRRLQLLSIRGKYVDLSLAELQDQKLVRTTLAMALSQTVLDKHGGSAEGKQLGNQSSSTPSIVGSIVDFEVLAESKPSEPTPLELIRSWRLQLSDVDSELRTGPLENVLLGATLDVPVGETVFNDVASIYGLSALATYVALLPSLRWL